MNSDDLFIEEIPKSNTEVGLTTSSVAVNKTESQNSFIITFSLLLFIAIILVVIYLLFKKTTNKQSSVPDYRIKNEKNKQNIKVQKNKLRSLETPKSLKECIKTFLERTK